MQSTAKAKVGLPSVFLTNRKWNKPPVIQSIKYIAKTQLTLAENYETPSATHDNLTRREIQILNNLQKRTDIIIKKSDKDNKIVFETKENYIKDGLTHLADEEVYH